MSSNINWKSPQAIGLYVVGGIMCIFLAKEAFSSKPAPETTTTTGQQEPEARDVTEELTGRPSEAPTEIMNHGDDEGWKIGTGGKKSRKRRKNKTRKSRSKSKRRTKK